VPQGGGRHYSGVRRPPFALRPSRFASLLSLFAFHLSPLAAQQPGVDVQAYHFRVDLPDTGTTIRGWASVFFRPTRAWDDTLRLDLVGMTVERVYDLETLQRVRFWYDGAVLRVHAPRPRGRGGVVVQYRGSPQDGLLFGTTVRGRRAVFADNYPQRARYWLPVVDHPSDKARVLWSVRAPRGWRVVTNAPRRCAGPAEAPLCLESEPLPPYLMALGATRFTVSDHRPLVSGADTIPIQVWAYPEDSAFADRVPFRRATAIAETLQRLVGPFPYARLAHVQSRTRYGGMENASAIFYAERGWAERRMGEGVVRHETAHQWFGDAVTPRDFRHVWLSEGFASYFDGVAGAALDGDSVLARIMAANRESWLASGARDRPMVDSVEPDLEDVLDANDYQKGAWVLHMLRRELGDSTFFRGIREYYRRYRDSSVTSEQFQRVMEETTGLGTRLGWFYDQWLRQPGCPRLDVRWEQQGGMLQLYVRQAQSAAWGRFTIPQVPVRVVLAGGEVLERSFRLDRRHESLVAGFTLPAAAEVAEVAVDPDGALLMTADVHP
jgi:aminopeptidase N